MHEERVSVFISEELLTADSRWGNRATFTVASSVLETLEINERVLGNVNA